MCGQSPVDTRIVVNPREAKEFLAMGFSRDMLLISPDIPSGHAPAKADNRFPRMTMTRGRRVGRSKAERVMRAAGYKFISPEKDWENEGGAVSGGKPNKGTKKDKRLKKNKGGKS